MPTARELLEEADALMRRNRSLQGDDIPLLTDSVPVLPEAQVLRGRGAQLRNAPVLPSARAEPERDAPDSIPTLTERVEEEIDAAAPPDDGGDPSDWLRHDAGEPSVTGEVPDSVLVVPPPEEVEAAHDEPFFDDDRAPPVPPGSQVAEAVDFDDAASTEEIELVAPSSNDAAEEAFELELARPIDVVTPPSAETPSFARAAAAPFVDSLAHVPDFPVDADDDVPTIIDTAMDEDDAPAELAATPQPGASPPLPPEPVASAPPAQPVPPATVPDDTKWDGVAEEIRMQVLQRIDIFTDTGLREQLSLRLQPIVDRASADLVATINQHVGELLRAYVAEAIEREIESWRRSH